MKGVVGVIGASGYIGSRLCDVLVSGGWEVIRISRSERKVDGEVWRVLGEDCVVGLDALVNLAGERIDQRWTEERKVRFRESRVGLTREIAKWIVGVDGGVRLGVWLNVSAVGISGDRGDERLDEASGVGEGYLAELCRDWEAACYLESMEGVRIVHPRIGVVLGRGAPAWDKMVGVFRLGLGGRFGDGRFWFPWIHLEDVVAGLVHCLEESAIIGPVNVVAPESVRNIEYVHTFSTLLGKPACLTVPAAAIRLLFGEFGGALLGSQRVFPAVLDGFSNFSYRFQGVEAAIGDILERA